MPEDFLLGASLKIHHMMFKRKGGGVKGLLNNVQKNCIFLYMMASLVYFTNKQVLQNVWNWPNLWADNEIPRSRDFAKSRPGNPGIEKSWSRWSLFMSTWLSIRANFLHSEIFWSSPWNSWLRNDRLGDLNIVKCWAMFTEELLDLAISESIPNMGSMRNKSWCNQFNFNVFLAR